MQKIYVINQLLCEGNSKLSDALKKNDVTNAKIAQIMIDTVAKDSSKHSDELKASQSRDGNQILLLRFGSGSVRLDLMFEFGSAISTVRVGFGSVRSKVRVRVRFDFMKLGDIKTKY